MWPWGGYGANPLPAHIEQSWDGSGRLLSGGFPYSEGIFEDINKAVMARLYWDETSSPEEAVREYAAYHYSPDVVEEVMRAVHILERNHPRHPAREGGRTHLVTDPVGNQHPAFGMEAEGEGALEAYELLESVDTRLTRSARRSWRWRILLLRALIDSELYTNDGVATPACEEAFRELASIYCAERAERRVAPPSIDAIRRLAGE
jgi:hypothetical protein